MCIGTTQNYAPVEKSPVTALVNESSVNVFALAASV